MCVQKEFHIKYPLQSTHEKQSENNSIGNYISKLQSDEITNIYPQSHELPEKLELKETLLKNTEEVKLEKEKSE